MLETMEYAQDRYREQVAQGLVYARLERVRAAEQRVPDARRAGRVRRAVAKGLNALGRRLAASTEPGDPRSNAEAMRP
jgi:hypothetical protein